MAKYGKMAMAVDVCFLVFLLSMLYTALHLGTDLREDWLLLVAVMIIEIVVTCAMGYPVITYFSPKCGRRLERIQLRITLLNQSPFWRQSSSAELAREVWKAGIKSYLPLRPIDWLRYATALDATNSSFEPKPIVHLQQNASKLGKQRQLRKERELIASYGANGVYSCSKKYAVLTTGIPGRSVLARSVSTASSRSVVADCGLVELPGFLTEKECDDLVEEFDNTYGINELHAQNDSYTDDKPNPDAATYKMRYLHSASQIATSSKTPHLDKLKKMVKPFTNTKYVGKFKRYTAQESSRLGTIVHNDNSPYTLLIYLDTVPVEVGGYTEFVNLGLQFQPVKGNAIWFRNVHQDHLGANSLDNLDYRLRHCGGPLTKGTKTIIQFQDQFPT